MGEVIGIAVSLVKASGSILGAPFLHVLKILLAVTPHATTEE